VVVVVVVAAMSGDAAAPPEALTLGGGGDFLPATSRSPPQVLTHSSPDKKLLPFPPQPE